MNLGFGSNSILKKEFMKNHQLLIFSSIGIIFLSILFFHDLNQTNFQESDFYNKFCSKNYDISCEKINLK